jgi:hypothetical protein
VEGFVNYLEQGWSMAFIRLRRDYKSKAGEIIRLIEADREDSAVCKGKDWWDKNMDNPTKFQMKSYISRGLIPKEQKPIIKGSRKAS